MTAPVATVEIVSWCTKCGETFLAAVDPNAGTLDLAIDDVLACKRDHADTKGHRQAKIAHTWERV